MGFTLQSKSLTDTALSLRAGNDVFPQTQTTGGNRYYDEHMTDELYAGDGALGLGEGSAVHAVFIRMQKR